MIANGPLALAHCIEAVNGGYDLPLDDALTLEATAFGLLAAHRGQARRHARLPREARRELHGRVSALRRRGCSTSPSATFEISHTSSSRRRRTGSCVDRRERPGQDQPARVDLLPPDPALGARRARPGPRALRRRRLLTSAPRVETDARARDRRRLRARRQAQARPRSTARSPSG